VSGAGAARPAAEQQEGDGRATGTARRVAAAGLGLGGLGPFAGLFADAGWLAHAIGAASLVLAVSLALSPRLPVAVSLPAACAALVAFETVVVRRRGPTVGAVGDTWVAMARSWDTLLAASRPAATTPATATLPAVVTAAAVFAGAELTGRGCGWAPAAAVAVAAFAVASLVAGGTATPAAAALVLVAGILAVALAESRPTGARRGTGRWGAALPGAAAALAVVAVIATGLVPLPGRGPYDLHDRNRPPADTSPQVTPLAQVGRDLAAPGDPVLFRITLSRAVGDRRVRIATLDDYDGERWGTARSFTETTGVLGAGPAAGDDAVEQDVALTAAYDSVFLPALEQPTAVTGVDDGELLADPSAGTLRLRHPTAGVVRYHVTSGRVRRAPTEDERAALTHLPGPVPDSLGRHLAALGSFPGPREELDALEAGLRDRDGGFDPDAAPGHSYARLLAFLGLDPDAPAGARLGTSEQPAAAFAVLARLAGVPSRVVVGYDLPPTAGPTGELAVTAHAVHAWAEAYLGDAGWVAFDPTSPQRRRPTVNRPVPPTTTATTIVTLDRSPVAASRPGGAPTSTGSCGSAAGCARVPGWLVAAVGLAALPGVIVGAKAVRRRRRRRRGGPAARVLGAWGETFDRLVAHGVRLRPALTAAEVARQCRPVLGEGVARAVDDWAPVLDAAIYAAGDPADHLAHRAWSLDTAVAGAVHARTGMLTRVRVALDPRPLLAAPRRSRPRGSAER
jgi:hypothetical protein